MTQETHPDSAAAKRLIEKAKAFICLDQPFFATILLKHEINETARVPTLAVTPGGTIMYNPAFIASHTAEQVVWALCHEVMHYASGHALRRQHRDQKGWNIVTDRWINDVLNKSGVGQKIEGCVDTPGASERTEEDMYAELPPSEDNGGGQPGKGPRQPGKGNGDGQGDDPLAEDMEDADDLDDAQKAELDGQRKIEVSEAASNAKLRGKLPGTLQKFAEDTINVKTPWYSILERYMVDRVAVDTSWRKPNRRYAPDFYMPTRDSEGAMGEVVIQVDISGSVSREEIRYYNGHMKRIVEQCKPSKVHVIYTDTCVQKHEVFEKPEDMEITYHSGGGTRMEAGFEYISKQNIEPQVVVTLTDGYDSYTTAPEFPTVWCVSTEQQPPYGTVVHFDLNAD